MKTRCLAIGGILAAAALLAIALAPALSVTVRLARQQMRLVLAERVETGGEVRLRYRHSVEKTPVEGRFEVGDGPTLLARETRTTSVGTGLPNTFPERTHREGEWLVVDEQLQDVGAFPFYLARINRTRLFVNDRELALATIPMGTVITIGAEQTSLLRWLLWRIGRRPWPPPETN